LARLVPDPYWDADPNPGARNNAKIKDFKVCLQEQRPKGNLSIHGQSMLLLDGCLCGALGQGDFIVWQHAVKTKVNFLSNYMFIHTVNIVSGAAKFVKLYCKNFVS
jgi:hypothetical protein